MMSKLIICLAVILIAIIIGNRFLEKHLKDKDTKP